MGRWSGRACAGRAHRHLITSGASSLACRGPSDGGESPRSGRGARSLAWPLLGARAIHHSAATLGPECCVTWEPSQIRVGGNLFVGRGFGSSSGCCTEVGQHRRGQEGEESLGVSATASARPYVCSLCPMALSQADDSWLKRANTLISPDPRPRWLHTKTKVHNGRKLECAPPAMLQARGHSSARRTTTADSLSFFGCLVFLLSLGALRCLRRRSSLPCRMTAARHRTVGCPPRSGLPHASFRLSLVVCRMC